jgi:hypothetical protein
MLQETIVLTLAYILIVAIAFAPKCPQTVSPDGPVDYFPEVEAVEPAPIPVVETSLPVETAIATVTTSPVTDLKALTSKQLKAIARNQKIPRYGSLTKKQLILALT